MEALKQQISAELVECFAHHLQKHLQSFSAKDFSTLILSQLEPLALKQRIQLIADELHRQLPSKLPERYHIMQAILRPRPNQYSDEQGISGWGSLVLTTVIGQHGLGAFKSSLAMLKTMTAHFSSEFAVRYFLLADQSRALAIMEKWLDDPNHHVRRLVSEGTRPRLPWAMQLPQLIDNPAPILPLLTALRDDPEEYVRRSVANHLNDIGKDHPELLAELALQWMQDANPQRLKLLRHASRTLLKQGHPKILGAFGLNAHQFILQPLRLTPARIQMGDAIVFSCTIQSTAKSAQTLMIDYLLHFKKANGQQSAKVFKWKQIVLMPGETIELQRRHVIRPITTRRYYQGQQSLSLRINGRDLGWVDFELEV